VAGAAEYGRVSRALRRIGAPDPSARGVGLRARSSPRVMGIPIVRGRPVGMAREMEGMDRPTDDMPFPLDPDERIQITARATEATLALTDRRMVVASPYRTALDLPIDAIRRVQLDVERGRPATLVLVPQAPAHCWTIPRQVANAIRARYPEHPSCPRPSSAITAPADPTMDAWVFGDPGHRHACPRRASAPAAGRR
jgi:hypothetical protein